MAVVVIGVCTARRPKMLSHCLASIARLQQPEGCELHLVVADNEPEPNNRPAVLRFATLCPFPVHYVHEPRRGIAIARNAILDKADELGADWLAFTDDDCKVAADWLALLLKAAEWYGADVVYGRREFVSPPGTAWLMPSLDWHEGQPIDRAGTHNVLIAGWLFRATGLRFDSELPNGEDTDFAWRALRFDAAMSHGSDSDFSDAAAKRKARIVYSRKPVVWEHVPPERATFRHQLRLGFRYSASHSHLARRHEGLHAAVSRALVWALVRGPVAAVRLVIALASWPLNPERGRKRCLKHLRRLAGTAGAVAGVFGLPGDPYRKIVGS